MRFGEKMLGMGVVLGAVFLCASEPVLADSMPEQATDKESVQQFGAVETAPIASAGASPIVSSASGSGFTVRPAGDLPSDSASASADSASSDSGSAAPAAEASSNAPAASTPSGAYPKVMTPDDEQQARRFDWWPTDAAPGPVKDAEKSGYWWWPDQPGTVRPWGNQGYIYVRKIIFDYKETAGPMKPSLIIKRILKNVRVYFDYDKADIRDDASPILDSAARMLEQNDKADILITGNADVRGSEQYNQKLGERRAEAVRQYFITNGVTEDRIKILSRGKLDAMAPKGDIVGMQKDRNAQFMVAEVEEVMIPADKASFFEDKIIEEKQEIEGEVKVGFKEYVIQSGDSLWKIAEREYGNGRQWKRIYDYNQDVIANPDRPKKGTTIRIPIE